MALVPETGPMVTDSEIETEKKNSVALKKTKQ